MTQWLSVIGIGEDGVEGLSGVARAALAQAEVIFGGERHLSLAASMLKGRAEPWGTPFSAGVARVLEARGQRVVVLASGDPFFYGVGSVLARQVPYGEMACFPAVSSVSLACSLLGWAVQEARVVSLCGRPLTTIRPHLQPGAKLLVLSADGTTPQRLAKWLAGHGFGLSPMSVLERLGSEAECVHEGFAASEWGDVEALNLIALEVVADAGAQIMSLSSGLEDALFEHDGQMTKREIRAVTLSTLAPRAGETLLDVGAGSGSIAIEWLLRHPANKAIAVERSAERAERIIRNAQALGVPRLEVVVGEMPESALALSVRPDVVFVGGGLAAEGMFPAVRALVRPGGRIVANSVTLEGEQVLGAEYAQHGGMLTRIGVERLDTVGSLHAFRPAMRVTQYVVTVPDGVP
ncbi:precorrin-6y C5,15-methyltransferase (decarboxylating) subunit CbiE [Neokomagataea anthophila]|uniref:Precorrin-6y C5,15-methyltransferase (Decarboxylating) subunit CbiE n=1 Tax=Neokomagataea anthophila TaxID=2826925 RepID=A0ABS5E934_9PROT|nr:precorrin-6y C5,15-methyltransferase (decarboxylating) subunit CbiE [Neokomagataea anthophila]MBR0560415.1 precorrin-6y C5,15-methyltransferase (decarboxylating) subunit CbiE [Neokomagataea anthophila]